MPQNRCSFPFDPATPPPSPGFAIQKRPLAYIFLPVKCVFWRKNEGLHPVKKCVKKCVVFCDQTEKVNSPAEGVTVGEWV